MIFDGLVVGLPMLAIQFADAGGMTASGAIVAAALTLAYFFACETLTGQTLGKRQYGLRVVMADGSRAPASRIAARTVLRIVDALPNFYLVGGLCMLLTDHRRQRIGDLVAGTVVTRASYDPGPELRASPLLGVYPAVWVGAAVAFALLTAEEPRAPSAYLAAVDQVCAARVQQPQPIRAADAIRIARADERAIARLRPGLGEELLAREIVTMRRRETRQVVRSVRTIELARDQAAEAKRQLPILRNMSYLHQQRFAELGLDSCVAWASS